MEIVTYGGRVAMALMTLWDKENSPIQQLSQDVHVHLLTAA